MVIADGAPTYVTVDVAGPLQQLEQLTADLFTVQVDLSGYGPGEWELVPSFQGPNAAKFPYVTAALREQHIRVTLLSPAEETSEETQTTP